LEKKFFTGLVFGLALVSCAAFHGGGADDASGGWHVIKGYSTMYTAYSMRETAPLFAEQKRRGPRLEFAVDTLDINDKAGSEFLQRILYGGLSGREYAEKMFGSVRDDYLTENTAATLDPQAPRDWSYMESFEGFVYDSILVISRSSYIYSGGAHGRNEKTFFVLDMDTRSRIALEDILGAEGLPKKEIDDALRTVYGGAGGEPLTGIGFFGDTAPVTGNFFVSREGLGFCWNPYEIAPYSMGTIEIVLPYDRIESLLNERGRGLFSKLK
jgi:hypothetical protein